MMDSLSILHICPRPSFSGLEAYALSLAIEQKNRGLNIAMMVLPNSPLSEKCQGHQISVLTKSSEFTSALRSKNWQILHLHSTQDLKIVLPSLFLAKLRGQILPKIVLQTHILISHSKKDPLHFLEYLFVDEMWCSSSPAKALLTAHIPIAPERIKVIRYGRDIEATTGGFLSREASRQALGVANDAIVVGLVSRIDPQKGIREFLEGAIPILEREARLNLVFIGGRTENDPKSWAYLEDLEKFHQKLEPSIAQRIHFKGAMKDSYQYMTGLDLYALPSYKECFALSLLEAQLAGLPVLGTSSGGTPDIVIEDQTGFLFEPESAPSAGEALKRALTKQNLWKDFGARARARVIEEFDFKKICGLVIEKYLRLANS